jgi:hypothetical protein
MVFVRECGNATEGIYELLLSKHFLPQICVGEQVWPTSFCLLFQNNVSTDFADTKME